MVKYNIKYTFFNNIGFGVLLLILQFLSACTDDESIVQSKQAPLEVSVGIDSIASRAMITGNAFENGSSIGVFVIDMPTMSTYEGKTLHNICYTAQNMSGTQKWLADDEIFLSETQGGVCGYYPFSSSVNLTAVPVHSGSTDYMLGYSSGTVSASKPNAALTFSHALHAFNINISLDNYRGEGILSDLTISSSKLALSKTVNLVDASVTYSGEGSTLAVPLVNTALTCESVRAGQIMAVSTVTDYNTIDMKITATIDGKVFMVENSALYLDLTDGYCTDLNIIVSGQTMSLSGVSVSEWGQTDMLDESLETKLGNVNITGLNQEIAVNSSINADGSVTITAMPLKKGFFIEEPTLTGTGNLALDVDYSTGRLDAVLTDYSGDVSLTFNGLWEPLVATYSVADIGQPTELLYSESFIDCMIVDGQGLSPSKTFTFSETGEQTVLYKLDGAKIDNNAFRDVEILKKVTIPNSVTNIGNFAFRGCSGLTSLDLGTGVQSIGDEAFYMCTGLTGQLFIPNSVTGIGSYAFRGCSGLTSLDLGTGVQRIWNYAFYECTGLTGELIIPNSVTNIGNFAFRGCSGLTSLDLGTGVQIIGDDAFAECSGFTGELVIPNSVTSIGIYAFHECTGLSGELVIPNSVTSIGNLAFAECSGLISLNLGTGMQTIGYSVFYECTGLTGQLLIPNWVTSIGDYAFVGCTGLTALVIPDSMTSIGSGAFNGCTGLTSLDLGTGVQSIGDDAFSACSGLTGELVIPNSVTSIGDDAFYECTGLTSLELGTGVQTIGKRVLAECAGLTSITSKAITAPSISEETFRDVKSAGTLFVPAGAIGYDTWMQTSSFYLGSYNWTLQEITE